LEFQAGNTSAGVQLVRNAIAQDASVVSFHTNLGKMLCELGRHQEAMEPLEAALRSQPDNPISLTNIAVALHALRRYREAEEYYLRALGTSPNAAEFHFNLATLYHDEGRLSEAKECYRRGLSIEPRDGIKIRLTLMLPPILHSIEHIKEIREQLARDISDLLTQDLQVHEPVRGIWKTNFYLAYHGEDDRELQEGYARVCIKACPSLTYTAPHCRENYVKAKQEKIRIGFVSKHFKKHSIGKTTLGIVKYLSRELFEVVVMFTEPPEDAMGREFQEAADSWLVLPNNLAKAREQIAEQKPDILYYQDIGMEPFTFFLAFARLAPVQCTSYGHPVTTGIPNMDYFISNELWEPEGADLHYSEKLARLRGVASVTYYFKPEIPSPLKPRSFFGLSEDHHIYVCPQTLFKFHPEFDEILAGILRKDPLGRVVLIVDRRSHFGDLLRARFSEMIPDVADRIIFAPRQTSLDFTNLIAVSDVMLDTIHFCGMNTSMEGFAVGTPIVTMPGRFMRSRHTYGFYRKMGIMDCVADSKKNYIDIAVRLGTDPGYRDVIHNKIMQAQDILWEEAAALRELERFFLSAAQSAAIV
jgi:predicted O-linked N-acetylglucosamine transferase (SPINDLY family)